MRLAEGFVHLEGLEDLLACAMCLEMICGSGGEASINSLLTPKHDV
jgi:hypothetical protein